MNISAGFIGYGGFVLAVTLISVVGYWHADRLENWARRAISERKARRG